MAQMLRDSSSERAWARRDQPWSWHWVMSFLTTFPEDVYPMDRLAETIGRDTFDIELAQALMWMSQAAYETTADSCQEGGTPKLERILGRWGFACRARLSQGGTEGFVAESEAAIVVAFAGTDPVVAANWITDFNVRTDSDGIHRGFADGVEGILVPEHDVAAGVRRPIGVAEYPGVINAQGLHIVNLAELDFGPDATGLVRVVLGGRTSHGIRR